MGIKQLKKNSSNGFTGNYSKTACAQMITSKKKYFFFLKKFNGKRSSECISLRKKIKKNRLKGNSSKNLIYQQCIGIESQNDDSQKVKGWVTFLRNFL